MTATAARLACTALLLSLLSACAAGMGGADTGAMDTPVGTDLPEDAGAGENEDDTLA